MPKLPLTVACLIACLPSAAWAQEAVEEGAEDAFGRRVGVESIGLYSGGEVRGFNLENAGNFRIEGNYFARAASPQYLVRAATTNRVGVNALRYDFPAPSGVVEYDLRRAPSGAALGVEAGTRAYSGPFMDINGTVGSSEGKWGLAAGVNLGPWQRYVNDAGGDYYGGGVVARVAPSSKTRLAAFATLSDWVADPDTGYVTDGTFIPPRIRRGVFRAQRWTKFDNREQTAGLFGSTDLAGWSISGGAFHSAFQANRTDFNIVEFEEEGSDAYQGTAIVAPRRSGSAQSGSVLVAKSWGSDALRHRVVATGRYRRSRNVNSPSLVFDAGSGDLDSGYVQVPKPSFSIADDRTTDDVTQSTLGAGYRVTIANAVELRGDVQKTDYVKDRTDTLGVRTRGKSRPWLYSGSASWGATDDLTVFASYSKGLEESGVAPNGAVNRGEVLPAVIATQRELGFRYALTPDVALIAGLFDTRKDTPGVGPDGRFDLIGEVRHRGFEASIAGALTKRLSVIAGVMLMDAKISGELVDSGAIGRHAVGRSESLGLFNLVWRPRVLEGLSLDGTINHQGGRYVSSTSKLKSEPLTTVDLGLRYSFKLGRQPLYVRARAVNVFDTFAWVPDVSGTFFPSEQRGFTVALDAEF